MTTHLLKRTAEALACALVLPLALAGCWGDGDSGTAPPPATYAVGGVIAGLAASGLVLANGKDTVSPAAGASTFTVSTALASGTAYDVQVAAQPANETCTVAGGGGTVAGGDVGNIQVTCVPATFGVGGSIAGLAGGGLVLANGGDRVSPAAGASIFTFPTPVASGGSYAVTIVAQPAGATCSVANAGGAVGTAPVTSIAVTCAPAAFPVGGNVSGLTSTGLVLTNGSDTLAVPSGAQSFVFPTPVATGGSYAVTVSTQPPGLSCSVAGGTGSVGSAAVNGVQVTCGALAFTLGGGITGLTGAGLVLANGADTVQPAANATSFVFPTPVAAGGTYSVAVQAQPSGQTCTVAGTFPATMGTANVTTIAVTCSATSAYTLVAGQQTCPAQTIVDGTGAAASLNPQPTGAALDGAGNYYTFDGGRLRKVTPAGVVTTMAGGAPGNGPGSEQDGTGSAAVFGGPNNALAGLAVDASGNVFVADWHAVRKVTPAGVVTTFAGSTSTGFADGTGTAARFHSVSGLAFDAAGNLVVGDGGNFAIRRISAAGVVTTLAQGGAGFVAGAASNGTALGVFSAGGGIAVSAAGNLLVASSSPLSVQQITPSGIASTLAGSTQGFADGVGAAAKFYVLSDVSLDATGNLYAIDSFWAIRKVTSAGSVSTPVVANAFSSAAPGAPAVPAGALVAPVGVSLYRALATPAGNFFLIVGCSLQRTGP